MHINVFPLDIIFSIIFPLFRTTCYYYCEYFILFQLVYMSLKQRDFYIEENKNPRFQAYFMGPYFCQMVIWPGFT